MGSYSLGLRIRRTDDVQVSGDVLVVGVDETDQQVDLDGKAAFRTCRSCIRYNAVRRGPPTNFRQPLIASTPPFLQFITRGLAVLSGTEANPVRRIFRDVDGDGIFEEPIPGSDAEPIADNCPTIPNSDQRQGTRGVGEACQCPVLRVETVRTFAGSRVRVPVDFEPGLWDVSAMNFSPDAREGLGTVSFDRCQAGPIVRAARANFTCSEAPPGILPSIIVDAGTQDVRRLGAGEASSYELAVASGTSGRTFGICVDPATVAYGDPGGFEIALPAPPALWRGPRRSLLRAPGRLQLRRRRQRR